MFRKAVATVIKSTPSSVTVHTILWCVLFVWNAFQIERMKQVFDGFDVEVTPYMMIFIDLSSFFFKFPVALLLMMSVGVAVDLFVLRLLKQEKSPGLRQAWFWLMTLIPTVLFFLSCFALAEILLFALKES